MKIAFDCHVVYDKGNIPEEPTMEEALERLSRGELNMELIPLFFDKPTIILTVKKHEST